MERDTSKYLLYHAAIRQAVADLVAASGSGSSTTVRVAVVGPGLGRLIQYALDGCDVAATAAEVVAIEANPACVELLQLQLDPRVELHLFALGPRTTSADLRAAGVSARFLAGCDLVVSELLGSFGDNEFMPELLAAAAELFGRPERCVLIPESWHCYHEPVYAPQLDRYLRLAGLPAESAYVSGRGRGTTSLAAPRVIYSGRCGLPFPETLDARIEFQVEPAAVAAVATAAATEHGQSAPCDRSPDSTAVITGVLGYFTSSLYRGLYEIDSRHGSPAFNAFHWEAFYFPLRERIQFSGRVAIGLRRRYDSTTSRLWYEWRVDARGAPGAPTTGPGWHNIGGTVDSVRIERLALPPAASASEARPVQPAFKRSKLRHDPSIPGD